MKWEKLKSTMPQPQQIDVTNMEEEDLVSSATKSDSTAVTPARRSFPQSFLSGSAAESSSAKKARTTGTIMEAFKQDSNNILGQKAAVAFAVNRISFNIIENPAFIEFLDAYRNSSRRSPNRRTLRQDTMTQAQNMRKELIQKLSTSSTPVGIALDGWTNVRGVKVTNILLLCCGVAYYWCSITNEREQNTAQWLHAAILPKLTELVDLGIKFVAYVADNEAVMNALYDRLHENFPFLVRIPCAAHTIQLIVKNSLDSPRWKKVRTSFDEIIKGFAVNKKTRTEFIKAQESKETKVLNLLKPNDTRWNSFLYAAQRLLERRAAVDYVFKQSEEFWSELEQLVHFLEPFQFATDAVQQDSATLNDVFLQFNMLSAHVSKMIASEEKVAAIKALRRRWQLQSNVHATIACAILSLEPQYGDFGELIDESRNFICTFGADYMFYFKLSSFSRDELIGRLRTQLTQFVHRRDKFKDIDDHIRLSKLTGGNSWKAIDVWGFFTLELAVVATALLTMPASEAAVERSFSAQDSIHTKKRNRLYDESVEATMFIAFNTRPMRGSTYSSSPNELTMTCKEMSQEFIESDTDVESDIEMEVEQESKSDSDLNYSESEDDEDDDDAADVDDSPPSSAAAAAAVPRRTRSNITADTDRFLRQWINEQNPPITAWHKNYEIGLDAAALKKNLGGPTTKALVTRVKYLLANP
jgi:hypothetical protein